MKKQSSSCSRAFKIIAFTLTACMLLFAFIHSAMPADVSEDESGSVLSFLQTLFNYFGLNAELTDHIVRKSAHFIEYAVIGGLLMTCAYSFNRYRPHKYSFQVLFAGLASAVVDETIQLNVTGRSGQISDVLLDFSGVLFGAILMYIIFAVYRKARKLR